MNGDNVSRGSGVHRWRPISFAVVTAAALLVAIDPSGTGTAARSSAAALAAFTTGALLGRQLCTTPPQQLCDDGAAVRNRAVAKTVGCRAHFRAHPTGHP